MSPNPRGDSVVRWTIVFGVIDTIAVMLRFYVRKYSGTKIAADDWMIMASLVPAYCMIVSASLWVSKGGAGKHMEELTASELTLLLKYIMPAMITYGLTITAVKISILLLYRRVFHTPIFKRATLVVGFLCIAWLCGNVFSELFLCSPISAAWDPRLIFSDHCRDFQAFLIGITVSNLLLDVIILCTPLPMIWDLNLTTRKKLEVTGVFLLGSFTCVSSLIRILSIGNIKDEDFPYTFLSTYLWSHIEPATAIWCACLMTYRPLFAGMGLWLQTKFGGRKPSSSNQKMVFNSKTSNSSSRSGSNAWASLGPNLRGKESTGYKDISANGNHHVVIVSVNPSPPDHDPSFPADEYECSEIAVRRDFAVRRDSSPV
ncbi:hypothetical protein MMC07_006187 [Pseudocyphellaria aurata]|nr:hypothetical protein [Pseudocyphellaria aurata]